MQALVTSWCHLIGITSDPAIDIAVGIVGGSSLVLAVIAILYLALGAIFFLRM